MATQLPEHFSVQRREYIRDLNNLIISNFNILGTFGVLTNIKTASGPFLTKHHFFMCMLLFMVHLYFLGMLTFNVEGNLDTMPEKMKGQVGFMLVCCALVSSLMISMLDIISSILAIIAWSVAFFIIYRFQFVLDIIDWFRGLFHYLRNQVVEYFYPPHQE